MNVTEVQPFVLEGRFVWTMTTNGYKYYTLNLLSWLREVAKVPWKLCVFCCDRESYSFFRREGVPCVLSLSLGTSAPQTGISAFGTESFSRLNEKKLDLLAWVIRNAAELGILRSAYLDGDIVVQQDLWPTLDHAFEETSLVFQCDCANDDDHKNCGCVCTGVICVNHEALYPEKILPLCTIDRQLWQACEKQDQPYVQRRLVDTGLAFSTLQRHLYGNGHWQKSGKWKSCREPWVLLHYNYRVGDTKKAAMRQAGHWRIPY